MIGATRFLRLRFLADAAVLRETEIGGGRWLPTEAAGSQAKP
ncbi:hypothetical protein EV561_103225 [Rhizobium sp. BK376]|jgi:hypothetical protein|nr:hypothetical protein EV561_103225 [Rhizobium sp. BK376]